MFASRRSRSRTRQGVTRRCREPATPTSVLLGDLREIGSDRDVGDERLGRVGEREADPPALVFLERLEDFVLEGAVAGELGLGLRLAAALTRETHHPLFHPRDVPLL